MAASIAQKMDLHHSCEFLQFNSLHELNARSSAYALVVLNYHMPLITLSLWSRACFRICADGGANRLYDCVPKMFPNEDPDTARKRYKPDVIKGDLDSICPRVKMYYQDLGTIVLDESHDQDTTDMHKCVSYILNNQTLNTDNPDMKILVVGALGGRLDHEFGNLNVLYNFPTTEIVLLSDENMTYLLSKEFAHKIHVNAAIEGPYCGLVPLGAPSASTTTTGLKWNLEKNSMEFGGLISVCNQPESDTGGTVTVESDVDLVWTVTIEKLYKRLQGRVT